MSNDPPAAPEKPKPAREKCPECKRLFVDVAKHIERKHQDSAVGGRKTKSGLLVKARNELLGALKAGASLELAALAAGIDDIDQVLADDRELFKRVEQESARGEVALLKLLAKKRPAFVLERTRPEEYGGTKPRDLKPEEPDDELADIGL